MLGPVPLVGDQRQGVLDLATDVQSAAGIGITLLDRVDAVTATSSGTTVDLPRLAALVRGLQIAHIQLAGLQRPTSGLWGPIGAARAAFNRQDARLTRQLARGQQILDYAKVFLGAGAPRTYLLAAENNAEMRDQGAALSVAYMHASGESTEAEVMSIKKFSDGQSAWTTLAKSANTAEAGWQSLVDGYEWRISHERNKLRRVASNPRLSRR
jgi:hypothetical protein